MTTVARREAPSAIPCAASPLARKVAAHGLRGEQPPGGALATEPLGETAWQILMAEARAERLLGLLTLAVSDGMVRATDEQATELHDAHVANLSSDLARERELVEVVDVLTAAGLDHRVIKGSAVAHLDYPDPSMRSFNDVDILIRSDQWQPAVELLASEGWKRQFLEPRPGFDRRFVKGTPLVREGHETELDLHRTFAYGPFGLSVRLEEAWSGFTTLALAGRDLKALPPEERVLNACFNAVLGGYPPRIVPVRDVAQMLCSERVDLDRVVALATSWHAEAVLAQAVRDVVEILDLAAIGATAGVIRDLHPRREQSRALATYLSYEPSYVRMCVQATWAIPGTVDKARYLAALAFPKREFLDGRHEGRSARWKHAGKALVRSRRSAASADGTT